MELYEIKTKIVWVLFSLYYVDVIFNQAGSTCYYSTQMLTFIDSLNKLVVFILYSWCSGLAG